MRTSLMLFVTASLAAEVPWWQPLGFGAPAPAESAKEHDPPWAGSLECGWRGEILLCTDNQGRVTGAFRRHADPVQGGERLWLQTAGLEWRSGYRLIDPAPPDGLTLWRWGQHQAPFDGWDVALTAQYPRPLAQSVVAPRSVSLVGGEAMGEQLEVVKQALSHCGGAALDRFPAAVLYDKTGEARLVRFQAFPPEDADLDCVSAALGGPNHAAGGTVELMLTLR